MEAPDKIYINNDEWHYYPVGEKCEEYIRKDALLEWAEAEKEKCSIGLSEYDMGKENGKLEILNGLIDKLNLM